MQNDEARRLRQEWGTKPCLHPSIESEFFLGTRTGEFNCSTCGQEFVTRKEWEQAKMAREQKMRTYQELAECLARYQHQLEESEQRLQWNTTQKDPDLRLALEKDQLVLAERIALLTWIAGFSESDGYTKVEPR